MVEMPQALFATLPPKLDYDSDKNNLTAKRIVKW